MSGDTAALHEVVGELNVRRRYIKPTVRNLDTGETYSVDEVHQRVPQGIDPVHLSPSSKRAGLQAQGKKRSLDEILFSPIVPFIPDSVTPNSITYVNHFCNYILLFFAAAAVSAESPVNVYLLIGAALFNTVVMALDCLDGMHARRTGQTSRLGEALDHYLDAVHTPFISAGLALALRLPPVMLAANHVLNVAIYNSELIIFHHQHVFLPLPGVESQVVCTFIYLVTAYMSQFEPSDPHSYVPGMGIGMVSILGMLKILIEMVRRFDSRDEWRGHAALYLHTLPFVGLYLTGYMSRFSFLLTVSFVSFSLNGGYVLNTLLKRGFSGSDSSILLGCGILSWAFFAMDPLEVRVFYSRVSPAFVQTLTGGVDLGTVQEWLPFFLCAYLYGKCLLRLSRAVPMLRRLS